MPRGKSARAITTTTKWYAVRKGRMSGIFRSWAECKKQVEHFPRSEFKSFRNEQEARTWLGDETSQQTEEKPSPRKRALDIEDNKVSRKRREPCQGNVRKEGLTDDERFYLLQFDGGSRGNPGSGGSGACITSPGGNLLWEGYFYQGQCTNNQAEYKGLIEGLKVATNMGINKLKVQGDSMLVIKQVTGVYDVHQQTLQQLHKQAKELISQIENCKVEHIYRSANGKADKLANMAMDTMQSYERMFKESNGDI